MSCFIIEGLISVLKYFLAVEQNSAKDEHSSFQGEKNCSLRKLENSSVSVNIQGKTRDKCPNSSNQGGSIGSYVLTSIPALLEGSCGLCPTPVHPQVEQPLSPFRCRQLKQLDPFEKTTFIMTKTYYLQTELREKKNISVIVFPLGF